MADVAIVIGHHPDAPGAAMTLGRHTVHEHDFWAPFAHELAMTLEQSGVGADVVERPNEEPDEALAKRVNATGADAAIELHFNAAGAQAWGTEMLHYPGSPKGKTLAQHLQRETVAALGLRDRGLVTKDWPFLELTDMPAVICEPWFATNPDDVAKALTQLPKLQRAYRNALTSFVEGCM